jgi:hypothetical protein
MSNLKVQMSQSNVTSSTPGTNGLGLPFDKLKALSAAEGLRVDPERCFSAPP